MAAAGLLVLTGCSGQTDLYDYLSSDKPSASSNAPATALQPPPGGPAERVRRQDDAESAVRVGLQVVVGLGHALIDGIGRALGVLTNITWDRALGYPIERPKSVTTDMLEEAAGIKK